jgi:hypothetical protein
MVGNGVNAMHVVPRTIVIALMFMVVNFSTIPLCGQNRSTDRYDDNQVLLVFCDEGRLVDRGVTHTIFAGPMDCWIAGLISRDLNFAREFEITNDQIKKAKLIGTEGRPRAKKEVVDRTLLSFERDEQTCEEQLSEILTPQQQAKLPLIYLNLEGLMALRRSCFRDRLNLSVDRQVEIVKVVEKCLDKQAYPIHRAIFSLSNDQLSEYPTLVLGLRGVSAELDRHILEMLSDKQRQKLVPLIRNAYELRNVVRGPGT